MADSGWIDYCLAKPGAWRDEPWENDPVAKVGRKIFAFFGGGTLGLKCGDREEADLVIERYPQQARRMAYIGQHGWNTFVLDGSIPDDEIADLIDASYAMIVDKLPRKDRPV